MTNDENGGIDLQGVDIASAMDFLLGDELRRFRSLSEEEQEAEIKRLKELVREFSEELEKLKAAVELGKKREEDRADQKPAVGDEGG